MENRVTLDACRTSSSPRFFFGVGMVLFSFVLGWPMVALFGVLSAYSHAPILLLLGTAFYGFSHLVFMFGMYLAGPNCIRYADVVFSWILRKAVERALFTKRG